MQKSFREVTSVPGEMSLFSCLEHGPTIQRDAGNLEISSYSVLQRFHIIRMHSAQCTSFSLDWPWALTLSPERYPKDIQAPASSELRFKQCLILTVGSNLYAALLRRARVRVLAEGVPKISSRSASASHEHPLAAAIMSAALKSEEFRLEGRFTVWRSRYRDRKM